MTGVHCYNNSYYKIIAEVISGHEAGALCCMRATSGLRLSYVRSETELRQAGELHQVWLQVKPLQRGGRVTTLHVRAHTLSS